MRVCGFYEVRRPSCAALSSLAQECNYHSLTLPPVRFNNSLCPRFVYPFVPLFLLPPPAKDDGVGRAGVTESGDKVRLFVMMYEEQRGIAECDTRYLCRKQAQTARV